LGGEEVGRWGGGGDEWGVTRCRARFGMNHDIHE
jgi:hypothetical protein